MPLGPNSFLGWGAFWLKSTGVCLSVLISSYSFCGQGMEQFIRAPCPTEAWRGEPAASQAALSPLMLLLSSPDPVVQLGCLPGTPLTTLVSKVTVRRHSESSRGFAPPPPPPARGQEHLSRSPSPN